MINNIIDYKTLDQLVNNTPATEGISLEECMKDSADKIHSQLSYLYYNTLDNQYDTARTVRAIQTNNIGLLLTHCFGMVDKENDIHKGWQALMTAEQYDIFNTCNQDQMKDNGQMYQSQYLHSLNITAEDIYNAFNKAYEGYFISKEEYAASIA